MKIYKSANVWDEALDRIRWLFDEFPEIIVSVSGGKDSTVIYHLARIVAEERGRLPLKVMWLDQEAEWQGTVDYVRSLMYADGVDPRWYQFPFRLFNATSTTEHWLNCWDPEKEDKWIHPQDPISIKENIYKTDRFTSLFTNIARYENPDNRVCYLAGVRAEESPTRFVGMTHAPTYKGRTWGKLLDKTRGHVTMYPIYDWSYSDVWKSILDNEWAYNRIYNAQWQYGVPVRKMRISNVHHETAVETLFHLQEIEPETWQRLTQRIGGIDTAGKMGSDDFFVRELPFMFRDWKEYRDYLMDCLITDPSWKKKMQHRMNVQEEWYADVVGSRLYKVHVQSILTNDWELIKLDLFDKNPQMHNIRVHKRRIAQEVLENDGS